MNPLERLFPQTFGEMMARRVFFLLCCSLPLAPQLVHAGIRHDAECQKVTISDGKGNLVLRLDYSARCVLDQVKVGGRETIDPANGVCSGIKVGDQWFTTRASIPSPIVVLGSNTVTVTGIRFGGGGLHLSETWRFTALPESIVWRVDRVYEGSGMLEDSAFPGWTFADMATWTGGLLGHGGVAWCKLFDAPNASYGIHNGKVTFWNKDQAHCLQIVPATPKGAHIAARFSRHSNGAFALDYSVTEQELQPRHGLSRFRRDRQDIWRAFQVTPGQVSVEFALSAPRYNEAFDRGVLRGIDSSAVREICHTIARIGAIDERIMGSNGYYSDFAVLHEPWLAQLGLAINDPDYHRLFAETLDFQRQHAIGPDGRVKSRWCGHPGDEIPGTYDALGYYECQWGWLMDSQTSWVINVAEQYDFTGDRAWLQRQQAAARTVLEYLLRRDADGDGLVEMMTDSHRDAKGSDWIDVVWAAHENALVNAQLFLALARWADAEDRLGDPNQAQQYRQSAAKLKARFNQTTAEGGFWDGRNGCYAYWRNKDGSVHGTNLVVPVNFSAIGYGLCDDPNRRAAVLDRIETLMNPEQLFFWPLCFFSYAKDEGHPQVNWPFPSYENGDLFLAWGELGTRAYALHDPAIALKYVRNVLAKYAEDGLAFQRYLRKSQTGAGNDILANNCSIVVGLYRNIYGLQPRPNRLYLEPHLVPELDGTELTFNLRGQTYRIALSVGDYAATVEGFTVRSREPFGLSADRDRMKFYAGASSNASLELEIPAGEHVRLTINSWPSMPSGARIWTVSGLRPGAPVSHAASGLAAQATYTLSANGASTRLRSDDSGQVIFEHAARDRSAVAFELKPEGPRR
ncbi:MAG: hypothetical protein AB9869_09995 [Verrucomicrobiia bacterium]